MINIQRKEDCCGCGACYDACAKQAIRWEIDNEGFSYPIVDKDKCVDCGLCNKACPVENSDSVNQHNDAFSPRVFAAYHKDEEIRFTSTSGGAFWGLAESWINNGGYVAGAIFTRDFKVRHIVTNNYDELLKIKGSKYCQSDARGMFRRIKELLVQGQKVMATGLPCQMAGLRQYLRKDYDNLIIVDIICHSVPSPLLFEKYVEYLEKKYDGKMIMYHPKNKELGGWHHFSFKAYFDNGKIYHQNNDLYTSIAFSSNYIMSRMSCYECHFKHFPQPSDLTIGDLWGIENIDPSYDSPKGVSKIVVNNQRGLDYLNSIECFVTKEYDIQTSVYDNKRGWSQIKQLPRCNMNERKKFVCNLHTHSFEYCVLSHTLPSNTLLQKIRKQIKLFSIK